MPLFQKWLHKLRLNNIFLIGESLQFILYACYDFLVIHQSKNICPFLTYENIFERKEPND